MPLDTLPNVLSDITHRKLDKEVQHAVESRTPRTSDQWSTYEWSGLLTEILDHSEGSSTKHLSMTEVARLIEASIELQEALTLAWSQKSFREIRNLAVLRLQRLETNLTKPSITEIVQKDLSGLSDSFGEPFSSIAVERFFAYLTNNQKLFGDLRGKKYYAKFCSIVQSSGTGKSRLLTELSSHKDVLVIYLNLEKQDRLGFPLQDSILSKFLTKFPPLEQEYWITCCSFFVGLFNALEQMLQRACEPGRDPKESIMAWTREMCRLRHGINQTRDDFFTQVSLLSDEVCADYAEKLCGSTAAQDSSTSSTGPDTDRRALKRRKLPASAISEYMLSMYRKMMESLKAVFPDDSNQPNQPKLVIAIDEAGPLTLHCQDYRPADVFCRAIKEYSEVDPKDPIWVVFTSTTSQVADFSPPSHNYNSFRVAKLGEDLFPPYTNLEWDQCAVGFGEIPIKDISRADHIASYGRPLWKSLKTALIHTDRVWLTASSKLCGGADYFDASNTAAAFAILGQRFGLDVVFSHPESVEHIEKGVASHLRICLGTTLDRKWKFTSYPSEPFLSCVAADTLHRGGPKTLGEALRTLMRAINAGMIDRGQRGELASRFLWLLSKDLFIRSQGNVKTIPSNWEEDLLDCRMIPVVDWLEYIFGPKVWDSGDPQAVRKEFENAYVNFSHWICMKKYIPGSTQTKGLCLHDWTRRHWQRTSAVQCCHTQPIIDKVIPIYFQDEPEGAAVEPQVSHIFISDKARESRASKEDLANIIRPSKHLGGPPSASDPKPLPYIAILADLAQPPSFNVTFPGPDDEDRCLRIYASSVKPSIYPFLGRPEYTVLVEVLQDLVNLQQQPKDPLKKPPPQFGATARPSDMEWEYWRVVRKV